MKIGVLIPIYNSEKTIAQTLDSVLNQSILPYEICLVDDGSTDQSEHLIREIAHKNNGVLWKIIHQENKGLGAARNAGLKVMTSDYISFLDSDDLWAPKKIEHLHLAIKQNPKGDLFYHPIWEWNDESGGLRKRRDVPLNSIEDIWLNNPITPSACTVRKKAMKWKFKTNPNIHGVEDALLWTKAFHKGLNFVRIPNVDTQYRIGYGMTKNVEEHEQHVANGLNYAIKKGWITTHVSEGMTHSRAYHMARNFHKSKDFKEARMKYAESGGGLKPKVLSFFAWLKWRL